MSTERKINGKKPLILCNPGPSWWFFSPFLCEIALGMKTEKYSRENVVALNPGVIYISTYNRQSETIKNGPICCIFFRDIPAAETFFKWEFYSHSCLFSIILKQYIKKLCNWENTRLTEFSHLITNYCWEAKFPPFAVSRWKHGTWDFGSLTQQITCIHSEIKCSL